MCIGIRPVSVFLAFAVAASALTACAPAEDDTGTPGPADTAAAIADVVEGSRGLQRVLLELGGIAEAADEVEALTRTGDELLADAVTPTGSGSQPSARAVSLRTSTEAPITAAGAYLGLLQLPTIAREGLRGAENGEPEFTDSTSEPADGGEASMQLRTRYADGRLTADTSSRMYAAGESGSTLVTWETKVDVLACPAPDGTITGTLTFDVETSTKVGDTVRGGTLNLLVSLNAQVDDDAHVSSIVLGTEGTMNELTSGTGGTTGAYLDGGATFTSESFAPGGEFSYDGEGGIRRASSHVTDDQRSLFLASLTDASVGLGRIVLDDVESFFRGGSCIDVLVSPGAEAYTEAGQTLEQQVTARSATDGADVEGRAAAELVDGGSSVTPSAQLAPTPAAVTYVGPSDPDASGTVSYEFVSRRGIGTLEVVYELSDAWVLDQTWQGVRYHGTKCGGPDGEWNIAREGVPDGNGGSLQGVIVFDLDPLAKIGYLTETSTLSFGSRVIHAVWSGMASFEQVDDETAILELTYDSGTLTFEGITESASEVIDPPVFELTRAAAGACATASTTAQTTTQTTGASA